MSEFNEIVSKALSESIGFLGESVVIDGKTLQAVVNEIAFSDEFQDGGMLKQRGITVVAQLAAVPAIGRKVIYKGKSFRILEVNQDVSGIEIICSTDAK